MCISVVPTVVTLVVTKEGAHVEHSMGCGAWALHYSYTQLTRSSNQESTSVRAARALGLCLLGLFLR